VRRSQLTPDSRLIEVLLVPRWTGESGASATVDDAAPQTPQIAAACVGVEDRLHGAPTREAQQAGGNKKQEKFSERLGQQRPQGILGVNGPVRAESRERGEVAQDEEDYAACRVAGSCKPFDRGMTHFAGGCGRGGPPDRPCILRSIGNAVSVAVAGDMADRAVFYFFAGVSTMVFDEPSGAACIPGGVWPCGLSAGAPPDFVSSGPVFPCGCAGPCFSGMIVRPVEYCESLLGSAAVVCWEMAPPVRKSPSAATAMRMISPG